MKKIFSIALGAALMLSLVACGSTSSSEAVAKDYSAIITETRADDFNEAYPVVSDGTVSFSDYAMADDEAKNFTQEVLSLSGIDPTAIEHYAISLSLRNTSAYCVAIVKPLAGHEGDVQTALENYVAFIQKSFEQYLPDQYEISRAAEFRTAKSGEIILVMAENGSDIADAIEAKLAE